MAWVRIERGIRCWVSKDGTKTYHIYVHRNGKTVEKKAGSNLAQARKIRSKIIIDLDEERYFPRKKLERIHLKDLIDVYTEDYLKVHAPKSWEKAANRLKNIQSILGNPYIDTITSADIYKLIAYLRRKGNKPGTMNRYRTRLNNLFKLAVQWGYCLDNPVDGIERLKDDNLGDRYLNPHEYQRLLDVISGDFRSLVEVAANTGMRQGVLLNLTWDDIDFSADYITVRPEDAKTSEGRIIPMTGHVRAILKSLRNDNKFVFPFRRFPSEKWSDAVTELGWDKTEVARLRQFRFHDLRHHFASCLVMKGASIPKVGKLLGHTTAETTMRYAHLAPEYLEETVRLLESAVSTGESGMDDLQIEIFEDEK